MENQNTLFSAVNFIPFSYSPYSEPYYITVQQMTLQIHMQKSEI
jgi:hypothetical protein